MHLAQTINTAVRLPYKFAAAPLFVFEKMKLRRVVFAYHS